MTEWRDISTAPKDGSGFLGYRAGDVAEHRVTWWGKTSHVPLYGWCFKTRPYDSECWDVDLWEPTHWMPLPEPPK